MPAHATKKTLSTQLQELGLGGCVACQEIGCIQRGFDGITLFCTVTAGFKDVSPWLHIAEAEKCPGKELRQLILSAPAHYKR